MGAPMMVFFDCRVWLRIMILSDVWKGYVFLRSTVNWVRERLTSAAEAASPRTFVRHG